MYNASFWLTKTIPIMFYNGYEGHLIMQEIGKFNQKINVTPNCLKNYMAFMLQKKCLFMACTSWILTYKNWIKTGQKINLSILWKGIRGSNIKRNISI